MISRKILSIILLFISISAFNSPPLYQKYAREYLLEERVDEDVIGKLTGKKPLSKSELQELSGFDNISVLHLLASNPSITEEMFNKFSKMGVDDIKTGLASNSKLSIERILSFRNKGKYSTVNGYVASNSNVPSEILSEMYKNKEALNVNFAINPNCPESVMASIYKNGNDIDKAWLATNPNLPADLFNKLKNSKSKIIANYAKINPQYK